MSTVAILGTDALGGALAHSLARRNRIKRIRLIDPATGTAKGTALDIQQAGAVERFDTHLATGRIDSLIGASVVVMATPVQPRTTAAHLLQQVAPLTQQIPVVCADATHENLIVRAVNDFELDRHQIVGSAPTGMVSSMKAIVALEAGVSPREVSINLLGTPGRHPVVPWSRATIAGYTLETALTPQQQTRLRSRIASLWPPGPITLAAAAAQVVEAILFGSSRILTCFVAEDATRATCAPSVGVQLGPRGVVRIITPDLTQQERVHLENATTALD